MIIYKDKISGDEVLSDTYPIEKCYGDALFKVKGKMTTETTDIDDAAIGGNASAEGCGDEGGDASSVSGINIAIANRLQQCYSFDKKSFKGYIKEYMKNIMDKIDESEVGCFKKGCQEFVKDVITNFDDYELFQGESQNPDGMVVFLKWEDDGQTPYMYFFKHGMEEEKV